MKSFYLMLICVLSLFFAAVAPTGSAIAQFDPLGSSCDQIQNGNPDVCKELESPSTSNPTVELISDIGNIVLFVAGFAAMALIIVNGIRYTLSGGDSNKISSAKNGIIFALVGIVLVIAARAVVALVISGL